MAAELGATATVNPRRESLRERALALTEGIGADAVVVTVGAVPAIESGLEVVRKQGVVNIFGGLPPGATLALDPNLIHYGELWLTGTQNANPEHYQRALALLPRIPQAKHLITHRFPIDEAPAAFDLRASMQGLKAVIDF